MANYKEKLEELLLATAKQNASDLHLAVGRRPTIRIDGALIPLEGQTVLTPESAEGLIMGLLDEAQKDYDLLILGASEKGRDSDSLFSSMIDSMVRLSPCITMVIHAKKIDEHWSPKRILVPISGSAASKAAAELSFSLISSPEEMVKLINVVVQDSSMWNYDTSGDVFERQFISSKRMMENLRKLAEVNGVKAMSEVTIGADPETVILSAASKEKVDLIILGTDVLPVSDRLFLGPRVERILNNALCPVIVLNS